MRDLGGSWMKIILAEFFWVSKIILVKTLFFLTFCEKIFRLSLIISWYHRWLGRLSWPWFPWLLVLSLSTTHNWICVSKRGTCCHLPCVCLCSWRIWSYEGIVYPWQFLVLEGSVLNWLYSTMLDLCGVPAYEGHYTFGILSHGHGMRMWSCPTSSSYDTEGCQGSCWWL